MIHTYIYIENFVIIGISKLYQLSEWNSFVSNTPKDILATTSIHCFLFLLLFSIHYIKVLGENLEFTHSHMSNSLAVSRAKIQPADTTEVFYK